MPNQKAASKLFNEFCSTLGYKQKDGFYDFSQGVSDLPKKINDMREKIDVDAVYGVNLSERNGYVPLIYFKKYQAYEERKVKEIYRKIWNQGRVPLFILILPEEIKIYNPTKVPPLAKDEKIDSKKDRLLETLEVQNKAIDEVEGIESYDVSQIESREFWRKRREEYSDEDRVDQFLLNNLLMLRGKLRDNLEIEFVNNLIIKSIFILYLEDRDVLDDSFYLEHEFRESSFGEILPNKSEIYRLFGLIKSELNGDIFDHNTEEFESVTEKHLNLVKSFLEGTNLETGQKRLFPYSFDIIPVELISSIYEEFVSSEEADGVHYTPQHVVDFMLSDFVEEPIEFDKKILDPACGSGVFLVKSLDKFIRNREGDFEPERIKNILRKNLFGIDKNPEAIKITAFSLYLKILDLLEIDTIEGKLTLPKLIGQNLFSQDFFQENPSIDAIDFDLVIGNPPWGEADKNSELALEYCSNNEWTVQNNQIAHYFSWKALDHIKPEGEVCFILPTTDTLINSRTEKFRRQFFQQANVQSIINLSLLRMGLFSESSHPASIIKYNKSSKSDKIQYITPTKQVSDIIQSIIVDSTDIKYISRSMLGKETWKIMMWGGICDFNLLKRLSNEAKLIDVLEKHELNHWEGFSNGTGGDENPLLMELPHLPTHDHEPYAIHPDNLKKYEGNNKFIRPKLDRDELWTGPRLLIKEGLTTTKGPRLRSCYLEETATFTQSIFAILGKDDQKDLLKVIDTLINSKLAQYYFFMASEWSVERDRISKKGILQLPCVLPDENSPEFKKLSKLHDDIVKAKKESNRKKYIKLRSKVDDIIYQLYKVDKKEIGLINDTVKNRIDYFYKRADSRATQPPNLDQMKKYAQTIARELNDFLGTSEFNVHPVLYKGNTYTLSDEYLPLNLITVELTSEPKELTIDFADKGFKDQLKTVNSQVVKRGSKSIFFLREEKLFEKDKVHIIKPNELRYWDQAAAANDSVELLGTVVERGKKEGY